MTAFARRVASLAGVAPERIERLAGGDLSEVLLVRRADGRLSVAKGGPSVAVEAAMLRAIAAAGVRAPQVESEHDGVLFLEYLENDRIFSPTAWGAIGEALRTLHDKTDPLFGWPVDYRIGTVELDNRPTADWARFWAEQRLVSASALLDRPWRVRVEDVAARIADLAPSRPRPSLLHGDLWGGNILVEQGRLAGLIDPACYHGDREVDLAMLSLFDTPPPAFWDAYGSPAPGWEERRPLYQLFPAIVHLRLFGASYSGLVDRLLSALGG